MNGLTVGFDLDMTLIDSRRGIAAVLDQLSRDDGVLIDSALATSRLGPPLETELAHWYAAERVPVAAERFRALYPELAVATAPLLPGAREAIDAVRRHGGRVVVVTGKYGPNARLHLDHLGLEVDDLVGSLHGAGKAAALRDYAVSIYVGDHLGDVAGGKAAGACTVGVATGPYDAGALRAAGADHVLDDLRGFPGWLDDYVLDARLAALADQLGDVGSLLVAFSGGADSAFLLAAAVRALGAEQVVAATAVSSSLPQAELEAAAAFASGLGVRHLTPRTEEMERAGYRANAGDRCWFCKAELLDVLAPLAVAHGLVGVATGTNADDAVAGFRPGISAAAERGAVTPLRDVGLTKAQVRAASQRWELPTWDKPAAACLSSRVAYGITITPERLARVERAEEALRSALAAAGIGVRNLRVRDLGGRARIEVDREHVEAVAGDARVVAAVRGAGFTEVEVDPRGFRSGALNELLPDPSRYR
jgi:uncharacterized protein